MSIKAWAEIEIKHGKLIDPSDPKNKDVNINAQTDTMGYLGYLWTVEVHKYLGDTLLHYALRERKLLCVYMLLYMDADPHIPNAKNVTPAS
eukprot:gene33091-40030_t